VGIETAQLGKKIMAAVENRIVTQNVDAKDRRDWVRLSPCDDHHVAWRFEAKVLDLPVWPCAAKVGRRAYTQQTLLLQHQLHRDSFTARFIVGLEVLEVRRCFHGPVRDFLDIILE
jgi:predicted kinase